MATIDFTCQKCEGNFELESQDLIDGSESVECPHCGVKLSKAANEDFINALAELQTQLAAMAKKFTAAVEFDSEDLDAEEEEEDDDDDEDDDLDEDDDEDDDDDLDEDEEDVDDDR